MNVNQQWREQTLTQSQHLMTGKPAPECWPAPCDICTAPWRLTPGGRWFIEHISGPGKHGASTRELEEVQPMRRTTEPEPTSDLVSRLV
jgi:hypothetical protein